MQQPEPRAAAASPAGGHAALLSKLPIFEGLPESDLGLLARSARSRRICPGEILFMEGDPGDAAYIVAEGRVDLVLESEDGDQIIVREVCPGGHFGEMALIDDGLRSATAVAAADGEVVCITREAFVRHLSSHPETMLHLLRSLSQRVRWADEKIKLLGFLDAAARLAATLLELRAAQGGNARVLVRHEQLAGMIGSTRQTVSSILGEWKRAGYLATGRGFILLLEAESLEQLAGN